MKNLNPLLDCHGEPALRTAAPESAARRCGTGSERWATRSTTQRSPTSSPPSALRSVMLPPRPRRERVALLIELARDRAREHRTMASRLDDVADRGRELAEMEWGPSEVQRLERDLEELAMRSRNLLTPEPIALALAREYPRWRRVIVMVEWWWRRWP